MTREDIYKLGTLSVLGHFLSHFLFLFLFYIAIYSTLNVSPIVVQLRVSTPYGCVWPQHNKKRVPPQNDGDGPHPKPGIQNQDG
jgi:hypothetical protein